jgi:hypothetical protein
MDSLKIRFLQNVNRWFYEKRWQKLREKQLQSLGEWWQSCKRLKQYSISAISQTSKQPKGNAPTKVAPTNL